MGRKRRKISRADDTHAVLFSPCIDHWRNSSMHPDILASPHLAQCRGADIAARPEIPLPRILKHGASPRLPYRRREQEPKSSVHWGQRKLLLSEIEFLCEFGDTLSSGIRVCCVYIGAAPGTHIPFLSRLFPHIQFILIDPSAFSIGDTDKISILNEFATSSLCGELAGRADITLCISDLRTADWRIMDATAVEEAVNKDMTLQLECIKALSPQAAMLKFRLPYSGIETVQYFDGEIYLPVYGPQTTTESRLVVRRLENDTYATREWAVKAYNEEMFYFNTITRASSYRHDVTADGLDYCYDCAAEVLILRKYIEKFDGADIIAHPNKVKTKVGKLVRKVSVACSASGKRTLINWTSSNSFEVKVYSESYDTLVVVPYECMNTDDIIVEQLEDPEENTCMSAWLNKSGSIESLRWLDIDEDALISRARFTFGVNGFGLDIPFNSAIAMWVWAVIFESLSHASLGVVQSSESAMPDGTPEQNALLHLRKSNSGSKRSELINLFSSQQRKSVSDLPTRCCECAVKAEAAVGFSREQVLALFSRTGTCYILWLNEAMDFITRLILPTNSLHHGSILSGIIDIQYFSKAPDNREYVSFSDEQCLARDGGIHYECCRLLRFDSLIAINGTLADARDTEALEKYVLKEFKGATMHKDSDLRYSNLPSEKSGEVKNSVSNSVWRADILRHSGLHCVE